MNVRDTMIAIAVGVALTALAVAAILEPIYDGPVYSNYSKEAQ